MKKSLVYASIAAATAALSLLAPAASARTITGAKISDLRVAYWGDDKVGVTVTGGTSSGSIGCTPTSGFNTTFLFNTGQQSGRNMLSVLTAAYLAGKTVDMVGGSACTTVILKGAAGGESKTAEELGHVVVKN